MKPELPSELAARFDAERVLGKGGMGLVVLARDRELDRRVAIKLAAGEASEAYALRFLREARTLAGIKHARIPRIFSFGLAGATPWLVQEFVDGRSLADGARPADAVVAMVELADALGAVHDAGLVHRDVKPGNVVLGPDGAPYLVDFGLVFDPQVSRLTRTWERVGTASYMAPEALTGAEPTPALDWYGWGATLYFLFHGRAPFKVSEVMDAALGAPLPALELAAAVPAGVGRVLAASLAKDPDRRPTGRAAIAGFLAGEAEGGKAGTSRSGPPAPVPARGSRPAPRRRVRRLAGGAMVAMVALLGAWLAWSRSTPVSLLPGPGAGVEREAEPEPAPGPAPALPEPPPATVGPFPMETGAMTLARWKLKQMKGPEDVAEVERLLGEAAREDPRDGRARFAQWFLDGVHRPVDPDRGVPELEAAVAAGSAKARIHLADLLARGRFVPRDFPRALRLFDEASAERPGEARRYLGVCYRDGRGTPADPVRALEIFREAYAWGDKDSGLLLALMLRAGEGTAADPEGADRILLYLEGLGHLGATAARARINSGRVDR